MSAMADSIQKAKAVAKEEEKQIENMILCGIAALFRAASISGGEDLRHPNSDDQAITRAQHFMEACKSRDIYPRGKP